MLVAAPARDTLVVGYKLSPPFVTEDEGRLAGPSIWLWEHVADELGVPYVYRPYNLDGLLSGLSEGEIDIGISPLTITSDRAAVMRFSSPYYIAYSSLLVREASSWRETLLFVRSFFSINFFRALGALALVILIFGLLTWLFERRANPEEFGGGWSGLWQGFWWSAVTMTTVGYGDKSPLTLGGRIVALVWMFTAIIIISGFTASIASALTVDRIGTTSNSLEDFKDRTIGTIATSSTEEWLRDNFYTDRRTYSSLAELQTALADGTIAAAAYDRPILQPLVLADPTGELRLLADEFNAQFYALGMRSSLPDTLYHQINIELLEQIESRDWEILLAEYGLR
jgi:ABC-type amino acid transport substrate-binding protein